MKHIFNNEDTVKEDISNGLKTLWRDKLISHDQFTKLMAMVDTLDMKKLINPLKHKYLEIGFNSVQIHDFPMPLYPTGSWSFISAKRA